MAETYSESMSQGARDLIETKAQEILRGLGLTTYGFNQVDPTLIDRLADAITEEIQRWD